MDGYSVRAGDTFGATESLPAMLEVVGEVPTGQTPGVKLGQGEAALAFTGGMLAEGADAVVMVERTQWADETSIEVLRAVAPGENVIQVGEDIGDGDLILPHGHRLRPQDIGGLLALGLTAVEVLDRPRVAIVSTGDELVPPADTPSEGQIRDVNTYTIGARVTQCGGVVTSTALVTDELGPQLDAARRALDSADILVFSAGSSLSALDMTARVFASLGDPGVLAHGISIRPGKPTIVAAADGKPLLGLPGNPVSALVVFDLLVGPAIRRMAGLADAPVVATFRATLGRDVPSVAGREDHVPVRLLYENGTVVAEPVFGKSNLIFTLVNSDGIVTVPLNEGGLYAGDEVEVRPYGP
jgi:molybdopterin molybdotransferase